ncbi:DHH family phosphoesterase [Desulfatitalea alkaliphila]|uniref:DHH family phosphoesterase n=1 Tax=Desulfatitalea alkaliphila TaxID=2929485 RepID=A0AA41QYP0_9BACT|nr:DHH family phosphoesterase [Desulfatitalea alkaliphila]MCJ8499457.1 DHH family phosphoesterase [Desulfatitalea alkaliphila]
MTISTKERLRRFHARFKGDDHVLLPIVADPDAIACAMAIKRLLWRKVAGVTIAHVNEIRRADNLVLIRLVGVALVPFEKVDPRAFSRIVLVDAQPDHHPVLKALQPDIIIDHHPTGESAKAPVSDIRPTYGATASILVEYLRAAGIKPSTKLATALYYAIKTDTANFERHTRMEDLNAFQFVFRHANIALARRIETAEIRRDFLKFFKMALDGLRIRKGRAFVHLGPVTHPDASVQVADFLMRIDTVNWSIVSGVYQRKLTIIFRNDGIRKDAGRLAKGRFGRWGSAGGHKSAARAEIGLEALEGVVDTRDHGELARWIAQIIEKGPGKSAKTDPPANAPEQG